MEEVVKEEIAEGAETTTVFSRETGDARDLVSFTAEEILQEHAVSSSTATSHDEVDVEDVTFDRDDWRLILVNKQHFIPEDYEVPLATIKGDLKCDERILDDLLAMLSDAAADGVSLYPCSPYRSHERQTYLFERKITYYMGRGFSYMEAYKLGSQAVTVPDTSEHQLGLAVDIVSPTYTSLNEGFAKTEAGQWLADNCYRYGFILRYPAGKEYITTIEFEPWHFRYVGVEAATYMTRQGITLEEFWEEMF
jgi:D-alanyl-D-alanine carboxypeptidase